MSNAFSIPAADESLEMSNNQNLIKVEITGGVGAGKSAVAGVLANALKLAGVDYRWEEEQSEEQLTGGHWGTQLRNLKPSVVIEELAIIEGAAPVVNLSFGDALVALEAGKRLQRAGWNGKGMFVYLVPANSYPAQTGAAKAHFGENAMVPYNPYFAIKNVDNTVSTWVPSVNDCLAKDWHVIDVE